MFLKVLSLEILESTLQFTFADFINELNTRKGYFFKEFYFLNYSVKCVSCFMFRHLMRCHYIWISEKLKFGYLMNEERFRSEINFFFLVSRVLLFRIAKQTSKTVADTTFNDFAKFTGNTCGGLSFFNKVPGLQDSHTGLLLWIFRNF